MSKSSVSRRGLGALFGTAAFAAGAIAASAAPAAADTPAKTIKPPKTKFTTTDAFDAAKIPPYKGDHKAVYAHIDAHQDEHLENLKRWVRQRSISAQNDGVQEMAKLVEADLKAVGF